MTICLHSSEVPRRAECTATGSSMAAARGWWGLEWGAGVSWGQFWCGKMKTFWGWMVTAAQLCNLIALTYILSFW